MINGSNASLARKARLIADLQAERNSQADYELELKIAYKILEALGVKE
jgi:hypothetical protein